MTPSTIREWSGLRQRRVRQAHSGEQRDRHGRDRSSKEQGFHPGTPELGPNASLSRFGPIRRLVHLRQTFIRRCQKSCWRNADAPDRAGGCGVLCEGPVQLAQGRW